MKNSGTSLVITALLAFYVSISSSRHSHWTKPLLIRGGQSDPKSDSDGPTLISRLSDDAIENMPYLELLGPVLLKGSENGSTEEIDTKKSLEGKYVALYLTSQAVEEKLSEASEAKQGGFLLSHVLLNKVYELTKSNGHPFEMVYVPVQDSEEKVLESFKEMPWLCAKPDNSTAVNLIRKAGVTTLPTVLVLDPEGNVITSDGIANMSYFPDDFPWKNKNLRELLGDEFEKSDGTRVGGIALDGKTLGLYFSAGWCAPCKQFTPLLKETYETLQAEGKNFEVIYIGSDKNETEHSEYAKTMPWLAIPYDSKHRSIIQQVLDIRALPTLLIFDENNKIISVNGRTDVMKDMQKGTPGASFPWRPKPLSDLVESPEALARGPVIALFMDGTDKKEQTKLLDMVKPIAEGREAELSAALEKGRLAILSAPRKATFLAATEIEQLSTTVRKLCGLDEIQGKWKFMKSKKDLMRPRFALISLLEGKFALSEETLNEKNLEKFLEQYDTDSLEMTAFNIPEKEEGEAEESAGAAEFN